MQPLNTCHRTVIEIQFSFASDTIRISAHFIAGNRIKCTAIDGGNAKVVEGAGGAIKGAPVNNYRTLRTIHHILLHWLQLFPR